MSTAVDTATRYLVEWYRPSLTRQVIDDIVADLDEATAAMNAEGAPVWLLLTLAVPTDEVLFGVFAASDPELVNTACARAGAVADRISLDVDARVTQHAQERSARRSVPPLDEVVTREDVSPRLVAVDDEPELQHPSAV